MEKTITIAGIYRDEKEGKYGKYETLAILDEDKQRYSSNKKAVTESPFANTILKGQKIVIVYEKEGKYNTLQEIKQILPTAANNASASVQHAPKELPNFPEAITDSEIDAFLDTSFERVAAYFNKPLEEVMAEPGLLGLVGRVFDTMLTQRKQKFQIGMQKREEAEKALNYERWKR